MFLYVHTLCPIEPLHKAFSNRLDVRLQKWVSHYSP